MERDIVSLVEPDRVRHEVYTDPAIFDLEIQRELVRRARAEGVTTQEIVRILVAGVGTKRQRGLIAREWCDALGTTAAEARRMAG